MSSPFFCYDERSSKAHQMPVNLEVKGSLAKCLATENLIIEHKKVPTAMFDVDRRVLTLPTWDKASATVYDLLVGHEVGHALFTDNIDWTKDYPEVPKDFVNVLEDVRVERLMKKKYPGLSRTFYNGYNELNSDDFFSTKEENLDELTFIDRINLYYKIGAFHNIAFSDEENEFLTRAIKTETFDEVLQLAREITEFVQYKRQKVDNMPTQGGGEEMSGPGGEEVETPQQNSDSQDGENQDGQNQSNLQQDSQGQSQSEGESFGDDLNKSMEAPNGGGFGQEASNKHEKTNRDELTSKTSRSFDEKSQDLVDKYAQETNYVELPKMNLETMVIPNDFIHAKAKEYYDLLGRELDTTDKKIGKTISLTQREYQLNRTKSPIGYKIISIISY